MDERKRSAQEWHTREGTNRSRRQTERVPAPTEHAIVLPLCCAADDTDYRAAAFIHAGLTAVLITSFKVFNKCLSFLSGSFSGLPITFQHFNHRGLENNYLSKKQRKI